MTQHDRSIKSSANRAKNKVYEYCRANDWEWFITLTFDPNKIDSTNYDLVTQKVSQWLKNMRKDYAPDLKYVMVPELHSDGRKFHFHALFSNVGTMSFKDSGTSCSTGKIYNLGNYKLGFTTATEITDSKKASNYLSKYITKELCALTPSKKRYWNSKNLDKPLVTKMLLQEMDIKKQLDSFKDQVVHKNTVDIDLPDYKQTINYYELSIT